MVVSEGSSETDEAQLSDGSEMTLVEIEHGFAVVFAQTPPIDMNLVPFEVLGESNARSLTDALAIVSGAGTVVAQGAQGVVSAQGLVRLAPETIKQLQTMKPMVSNGWNLGTLVGEKGKAAASIRWAPAAGAQSAAVLATLGPAMALLALQIQIASISRRVDTNIELTQSVQRFLEQDQMDTLRGLYDTTIRAVAEAQAAGVVNDHIYAAVSTREADFRKLKTAYDRQVREHIEMLAGDPRGRRAYVQKNYERIFADVHGLLMAEGSWHRAQVLRAAHIRHDLGNESENAPIVETLVAQTRREYTASVARIKDLVDELERQCGLIVELPADRSLPFTTKRQSANEVVEIARYLGDQVAAISNSVRRTRTVSVPGVLVVDPDESADAVLRILSLVLPKGEAPIALADVNEDRLISGGAYLVVTPHRVLLSSHGALLKQGSIEREISLSDVRYVRFTERGKQGAVLDLITAESNIKLTFDRWAAAGPALESARRLANLLAAAMHIPESERRTDSLLPNPPGQDVALEQHELR
ncbi:hypothetical protein D9V34_01065 [Mycetocola lacteus]|uniref:Uncharacterized protein n=2 Tax=Mycetocola lacteus TaxID=76637 RepID=A0A3L7AYM0_9MICO|nr:hypothetical protein D9V34_13360 [Mycetocola lacteus]RLP84621.1 hypothetical protein D9V34_01065 [Mycetocola lacteus]